MAAQLRHMAGQLDSLADQILDHRNTSMSGLSLSFQPHVALSFSPVTVLLISE